jgi:hypothetical protein
VPATPTVDREDEVAAFTKLLTHVRTGESRALIIEEASGRGKSRLLQCFKAVCEEHAEAWSYVDLVSGSLTPIDILKRIAGDLEGVAVDRCWEVLSKRSVVSLPVEIRGNKTLGSATFIVESIIHVERLTPEEQKQLWSDAAEGFRHDLRDYGKAVPGRTVVLLLDTFEKAAPESQLWISDHLLPAVARKRVAGLLIVVAGKNCPKASGEWEAEYESMSLVPLTGKHWAEYAKLVGSTLTEDQVKQIYEKYEGAALKMAETIGLFIPR